MPQRLLFLLTGLVGVAIGLAIRLLDPERLSALGSILAGAGSLLAVIWFSASLRYQSRQLQEQRQQFAAQFEHLKETSRRDALLFAKGILDRAEEKALAQNGKVNSISELVTEYMNFVELKPLLESRDPEEVMHAFGAWMKREGPAITLVTGVKSAAEVFFRSIGASDVDSSKPPEEFVFIYSPLFSGVPFFESVTAPAVILSEFMFRLAPGRKAAQIAYFAAVAKSSIGQVVRMEKLRADIAKHQADGYPLPEIAKDL